MDCFYAAVEVRDRPELRGKPVVVGGTPDSRSVVATANYEARRFGIRSAMPCATAYRLCPETIFLNPDFARYKAESRKIQAIMRSLTALIEPLSLDEAYLDVTEPCAQGVSATQLARELRARIWAECGLTASAGIAPNKLLAKVASEINKPNGQKTITPEMIESFMLTLPVSSLFGVGRVTARRLHQAGFNTCGDLQQIELAELVRRFGNLGSHLYRQCRGIDERPVAVREVRKSISVETTFAQDYRHIVDVKPELHELYADLVRRFERARLDEKHIKTVVVKIKFHDFTQRSRSRSHRGLPTVEHFEQLCSQLWEDYRQPFRLIGIGLDLHDPEEMVAESPQLSLPVGN